MILVKDGDALKVPAGDTDCAGYAAQGDGQKSRTFTLASKIPYGESPWRFDMLGYCYESPSRQMKAFCQDGNPPETHVLAFLSRVCPGNEP